MPDPEEAVFAAQPASVAAARRFVRGVIAAAADDDDAAEAARALADDAVLVVAELVSNAVLHAGGPVRVRAEFRQGPPVELRLDVMDGSPVPPRVRDYESDATTGRGLYLVGRLSRRWGIDPLPDGGKAVWAELSRAVRGGWPAVGGVGALGPQPAADALPVIFLTVPVAAYLELQEHNDGVLRELELLAFNADQAGRAGPSSALAEVIERARRYFNAPREGLRREAAEASTGDRDVIDLVGRYPVAAVVPAAELVELFERAEQLAEEGEMLVQAPPAGIAALRRWLVAEMSGQLIEGRPPRPFGIDDAPPAQPGT